jgi:hypothetical protein
MELAIIITFLYITPLILSVFLIIENEEEVTVWDLIGIILIAMLPIGNLFTGYFMGLMYLCESKKINDFLNKRIK